jgi:hypothetical protein
MMNVLYAGQADALERATTVLRQETVGNQTTSSEQTSESVQQLLDISVGVAGHLSAYLARAWKFLAAPRTIDPQEQGKVIAGTIDSTLRVLWSLEETCRNLQTKGHLQIDLMPLVQARERLERGTRHFRDHWPMVDSVEIEQARARYAAGEYASLEDVARELGVEV